MKFLLALAKKPLVILISIIALTFWFISAMASNAQLETDLNKYMPATHPAFVFSDQAEDLFGIQDSVLIVIEHPTTIFNQTTLDKIKELSMTLEASFPQIEKGGVTSLYTADNIACDEWGLTVEPFYTEVPQTPGEIQEIKEKVESNEMVFGRNVSLDGKSTLLLAKLVPEANTDTFYEDLEAFAKTYEGPETLYVAGRPIVEGALAQLGPADMVRMAPLVLVVMVVLLLLLLRSVRDMLINMVIVVFGTIAAFGVMAILNVPIYAVDTMIPVMLIAIGVAYGIHMHNAIGHRYEQERDISRVELAKEVLKEMVRPVFLAALTTAIGFMSLLTSAVLPVRYFGLFSALGVMTEMVLALILFPSSILLFGPPKAKRKSKGLAESEKVSLSGDKRKNRWGSLIVNHSKMVVILSLVVVAFGLYGTSKVWLDTSFLANFEKDSKIVKTDEFVNTHFGGTSSLNVILSSQKDNKFKNPEVLQTIDAMQQHILSDPVVGAAFSLTDFVKRMDTVLNDQSTGLIPFDQDLIAQYLLLFEFSGDPETIAQVVDYDYRTANMTFQLKSDSSEKMKGIIDQIETYKPAFSAQGISIQYAGSGYKAYVFSELLLQGQILSLLLSFVIVAFLLTLQFKNLWVGLASTIPIAITAVVNFGVMGLFNIPLSSATALISSIALGIGVDYSIHFLEHYKIKRLENLTIQDALFDTLRNTGRAIVFNAVAVMGGFSVLLLSVFPPNRQVGGLIVLNMVTSAIGTLSILVVVIVALDKRGKFIKKNPAVLPENKKIGDV
jgi:predicted RND superfamily exporter protein